MVLEPIKIEIQPSDAAASSSSTTSPPLAKKLEAYYLTDLSRMAGMKFGIGDKPSAANITTYMANEKGAGYHLISELTSDSTIREYQKFVKTKDTVINGDRCVEFEYNEPVQATFIKSKRTIVSRKILINNTLKDQQYSFINPAISAHFGGAIMIFETKDDTGMVTQVKYNYITNIPPAYKQLFDKYEGLFNANLNLLNDLKK
ncbi:MAG: hypothetical protein EOO92_14230 [Pedobacter sp.]|nr:MAG: hypothetical protein EOO92_14230 [Pedobacter sp.]